MENYCEIKDFCGELVSFLEHGFMIMRTSLNAGQNIFCPHDVVVPRELDGGHSLVKIIIPAKLKNAIMNELKSKGITKEYLLPN